MASVISIGMGSIPSGIDQFVYAQIPKIAILRYWEELELEKRNIIEKEMEMYKKGLIVSFSTTQKKNCFCVFSGS